jgi:hypothetical protein
MTGADGRYGIGPVTPGSHTLRARSGTLAEILTVASPRPAGSLPSDAQLTTTSRSSR